MKKGLSIFLSICFIMFGGLLPAQQTNAAYNAKAAIAEAKEHIGTPYQFGGTTPAGFDCSGFIQYVHKQTGYSLPRTAADMYKKGQAVSKANMEPGDLMFFTTYKKGASHVGIYLGNNQFIHASSSKGVTIDQTSNSYWSKRYIGSKTLD
ncbi:C40 family peptidase [Domibacillus indicus]|uniref:C40 family peptidase n=1 Tax=Domibacillus indicus TaxID=1437523 RepID=UPI00203B560C|nr:C40 family peptidase [Domibacillus indicus]MCM3789199.1 C40 family peptidase [Domibacillus indicus]